MQDVRPLTVRRSYELTVEAGYRHPQGKGWSSVPVAGYRKLPPRTFIAKVVSSYTSVTGERCYIVNATGKRGDTECVPHRDVLKAVAQPVVPR